MRSRLGTWTAAVVAVALLAGEARADGDPFAPASVDGVWERDDGALFRLARVGDRVQGYRANPGEFGTRLDLEIAGRRLEGWAAFSRREDEEVYFETAVALELAADGSLAGTFEAAELDDLGIVVARTPERRTLRRKAALAGAEAEALRRAAAALVEADMAIRDTDRRGALAKLVERLAALEGSPELAVVLARKAALERSPSLREDLLRDAEKIGEEQLVIGDFAGARGRWAEVLRLVPDDENARSMVELCDIALRAGPLEAAKDAAGLAKLAREAMLHPAGNSWCFLVAAHLHAKAQAAAPGVARHAFDRAVMLFHADRWEEARDVLDEIARRDPGARSKDGVLAIDMRAGLDEAIALKPRVRKLEARKQELAERYGYDEPEYERVKREGDAARAAYDRATAAFYEYVVKE